MSAATVAPHSMCCISDDLMFWLAYPHRVRIDEDLASPCAEMILARSGPTRMQSYDSLRNPL